MNIDSLVDKIIAKNAFRCPKLVISLLKSRGLDAVHVSGCTYKISRRYEWHYQAQDAAKKAKEILLYKCPELHIKNVEAYAECYRSIVIFRLHNEDSRRQS